MFHSMEAPPAMKMRNLHFKEYDNYFNLTMSYRLMLQISFIQLLLFQLKSFITLFEKTSAAKINIKSETKTL